MKRKTAIALMAFTVLVLSCRIGNTMSALLATPTPWPIKTAKATFTPLPTATLLPTLTRTPTARPTATKAPTKKALPTKTTPPLPTATVAPTVSLYQFKVANVVCYHSGQSFVEGLVLENSDALSGINGLKVRMSVSPGGAAVTPDYETQDHDLHDPRFQGDYSGYFWFAVNASGPAAGQVRYVWIVDGNGRPLSDPNAGKAAFNDLGPESPNSCWNVQIVFVKSR